MRAFGIVAAAATLGLALTGIDTAPALAGAPKVDASMDTVVCNTLVSTVKVTPPFISGGTATSTAITVKGILDGCSVSGPHPVSIISGTKFSGKLIGTSNDCAVLLGAGETVNGSLTIKWKTDPSTPLVS